MKSVDRDIQHEPKEGEERFEDYGKHFDSLPISRPSKEGPLHKWRVWKIMRSHPKDQIICDMS